MSQANLQAIADLAEEGGTYWSSVGETAKRLYPMDYNYYTVYQGVDQQEAGYNAAETLFSYMDESQSNYIFVIDMAGASGDIAERQYGLNRALGRRLDIIAVSYTHLAAEISAGPEGTDLAGERPLYGNNTGRGISHSRGCFQPVYLRPAVCPSSAGGG